MPVWARGRGAALAILIAAIVTPAAGAGEPGAAARGAGATAAPLVVEIWGADLGRALGQTIAVDSCCAFAATLDGRIGAVALADGRRLWRIRRDGGLPGGVVLDGERLLAASDEPDGWLYCLRAATGEVLWRADVGPSLGAPLVHGGLVLCGALPGRVTACSLEDGEIVWQRPIPGLIRAPLAMARDLVLVSTVADTLVALKALTGDFAWGGSPGGAVYGRPLIDAQGVWTLSYEGVLTCWEPAHGAVVRGTRLDGPFRTGLVRTGGLLVAVSTGGHLCAIDAATLAWRWGIDLAGAALLDPLPDGDLLWVALGDRSLRAVRSGDGREVARYELARPPTAGPVRAGDLLLIGLVSGDLIGVRDAKTAPSGEDERGPLRDRSDRLTLWQRSALPLEPGGGFASAEARYAAGDDRGQLSAPPPGSPIFIDGSGARGPRLAGWGRVWAAGWIAGTGAALWLQHEAEQAHERYEATGDPRERRRQFDRAERYDRAVLGVWVISEAMFLLMLRSWLGGAL